MNGKGIGFIAGLMIGLVLVAIFSKIANTDKKVKSEYDERQQRIRGKAYKYSFYTMIMYHAFMIALAFMDISIPVEPYVSEFLGIFLGCTVLGVYCIWNAFPEDTSLCCTAFNAGGDPPPTIKVRPYRSSSVRRFFDASSSSL